MHPGPRRSETHVGARCDDGTMTRYAIDADIALRIIRDGIKVGEGHRLVGPHVLRSHVLEKLYRAYRSGDLDGTVGRELLERLAALKIRLLGDRVSRWSAWRIADQLGWEDIETAEYLAVASLQADALITDDSRLRTAADGIVAVARFEDLVN